MERALKMSNEATSTLKHNMKRLLVLAERARLMAMQQQNMENGDTATGSGSGSTSSGHGVSDKVVFCLTFFHSVLLVRGKLEEGLGWNGSYWFSESDFVCSAQLIWRWSMGRNMASRKWMNLEAVRYLMATINYGGRMRDENDANLLWIYAESILNDNALHHSSYAFFAAEQSDSSKLPEQNTNTKLQLIHVPDDGKYRQYIDSLAEGEAVQFGQHQNADISAHLKQSDLLLETLMTATSSKWRLSTSTSATSMDGEHRIDIDVEELLAAIPAPFNVKELRGKHRDAAHSSLIHLMLQEMERLNVVLEGTSSDLQNLQKAMSGEIESSQHPEFLEFARCVERDRVPMRWSLGQRESGSLKEWLNGLRRRCDQLSKWSSYGKPKVFWLSGFQFVSRFLMALKQSMAKRQSVAIQQIEWEFNVINNAEDSEGRTLQMHPKQGAYVHGLYLRGAAWDCNKGTLCDPNPINLSVHQLMPVIHFKPIVAAKSRAHSNGRPRGTTAASNPIMSLSANSNSNASPSPNHYQCPLFIDHRHSDVVCFVALKTGNKSPAFWAKRGTALLLHRPH